MTTYVTTLARSLTSYSYMIESIVKKFFSKTLAFYYTNHCGESIYGGGHCGTSPMPPLTNHCGEPIGGGYRGHC